METIIMALALEGLAQLVHKVLNEDVLAIRSGGGPQMIHAKQKLQELEKYINYASSIIAGGVNDDIEHEELRNWITKAQMDGFCLDDQIAMYATDDIDGYQLYALKSSIGRLSIKKVTKNIQSHIEEMPIGLRIMGQLSEISNDMRSSHVVSADKTLGMKKEIKEIKDFLVSKDDGQQVLFVIGIEGSGKTTLIDQVYENSDIKENFHLRSRVNVSEIRDLVDLLKEVLEGSMVHPDAIGEFEIMKTFFGDKPYLIVLDDAQDTRVLSSLMHLLKGSNGKIICLTRKDTLVDDFAKGSTTEVLPPSQYKCIRFLRPNTIHKQQVHRISITKLGENDAHQLFRRTAFPNYISSSSNEKFRDVLVRCDHVQLSSLRADELDKIEETLDGIMSKCDGNPWKIKTAGTLLHKNSFENVGAVKKQMDRQDSICHQRLKLEDAKSPGDIRLGFLYCLAFPHNSEIKEGDGIPKRKLIRLWMAEGFLQDSPHQSQEQEAEDLLDELIERKLLEIKEKGIDGKVLKYSVKEDVRSQARDMCKHQKFCRFLPEDGGEASDTASGRTTSSSLNNLLRWRKRALTSRYRMLSVHGDGGVKAASRALAKDIRLRSLLYFKTDTMEPQKLELSFQGKYKLLRTLELQGTHLQRLPPSIGCLGCLRYLGLRRTQLENLPSSWDRLKHLMCLDIRDTNIRRLGDVSAFTEMRHLLLANSFREKSVEILRGLNFLLYLRTLSGAKCSPSSEGLSFAEQLSSLRFLRKLSVKKVPNASSEEMCRVISKMEFLQSLTITYDGERLDLTSLKNRKNLHKLKLGGDMGAFCDGPLSMMRSITYLYLWDSKLQNDPLFSLQVLPHLLLLTLCNAYNGEKMDCENGYSKLKKLSIMSMENLNNCTIGSQAMQKLEMLVFAKCGKLKCPPSGLGHVKNLKKVHLSQMLDEFNMGMEEIVGRAKVKRVETHFHESSRSASEGSQTTGKNGDNADKNVHSHHLAPGGYIGKEEKWEQEEEEFCGAEDLGTLPVDKITEPTPCKLQVRATMGFTLEVATATAYPGRDWIDREMPVSYASVQVHEVYPNCIHAKLDYPVPETEINTLGKVKHHIILWARRDIIFETKIPELSTTNGLSPSSSPPKDPSSQGLPPKAPSLQGLPSKATSPPKHQSPPKSSMPEGRSYSAPSVVSPIMQDLYELLPPTDRSHSQQLMRDDKTWKLALEGKKNFPPEKRTPSKKKKATSFTEEDFDNIPTKYEPGRPLVLFDTLANPRNEAMRRLHSWYGVATRRGIRYIVAKVPYDCFGRVTDNITINFEDMREMFRLHKLDINFVRLWCLMQYDDYMKKSTRWNVSYLDPQVICQTMLTHKLNEKSEEVKKMTPEQRNAEIQRHVAPKKQFIVEYIACVFKAMKNYGHEYVVAPYCFNDHYICLVIIPKCSHIWVLDSADLCESSYADIIECIQEAFKYYVAVSGRHNTKRPNCMSVKSNFPCAKQGSNTILCGYFVCEFLRLNGRYAVNSKDYGKIDRAMRSMDDNMLIQIQEDFCNFIMREVIHKDGDYHDKTSDIASPSF